MDSLSESFTGIFLQQRPAGIDTRGKSAHNAYWTACDAEGRAIGPAAAGGHFENGQAMNEAEAIAILCAILGGEAEVRHSYVIDEGAKYVRTDCETDTHVIEVGLDKRSSLDSVQQAEFASWLSGKKPMVILIDRDGVEGTIEYRVKTAARRFGVEYKTYSANYLLRWQMTEYFRSRRDQFLEGRTK